MVFLWLDVWRYIWEVKNKINCGIQLNKLAKIWKLFTSVIICKLKEEFILLKIITKEQIKKKYELFSFNISNLLILNEIEVDTKKKIRLIGRADDRKKAPK